MGVWEDLFCKEKSSYIRVELTETERQMLLESARLMGQKDESEFVYQRDNIGIARRWLVGLVGEYAVSKTLHSWGLISEIPSFKLKKGFSSTYDTADLIKMGFNLGCKTSAVGRNAKVKENCKYSEVICAYDKYSNVVYICGIATPEVLNRYSDIDLIEDEIIKDKAGTIAAKVGFNRYDKLIPFTKENVQRFKVDLNLHHHFFLTSEERQHIVESCTYIEKTEDTVIFRHCTKGIITEDIIPFPLTQKGLKELTKILEPNHLYLGYQILPMFENIQSSWVGTPLTIEFLDLWEILNGLGDKFSMVCNSSTAEEALRLLYMIYNPVLPYQMDSINTNFYTILWMLTR